MKRFNKLFIILLCCVGAMSITSCINSDDDGGIDPETYRTYLTQMAGPYNGFSSDWRYQNKIYFYNDTITDKNNPYKTDSVENISGTVRTDSTFTIYNVPGRVLAKAIPDRHKSLKEAIEAAPAQTIDGSFLLYNISSIVSFFAYPQSVVYDELTYDGETHKDVTIAFWGPTGGQYGFINSHKIMQLSLVPAAIYEGKDNTATKLVDICSNSNTTEIQNASLTVQIAD